MKPEGLEFATNRVQLLDPFVTYQERACLTAGREGRVLE